MSTVAVTLPPETTSVRKARRVLAEALRGWGAEPYEWTASQVLSELVTNSVIHAGTPLTVTVTLHDDVLRLEVADGNPRSPRERHYGVEATTGRGVRLVASLSRDWGVDRSGAGKVVWCELATPGSAGSGDLELDGYLDADELADLASLGDLAERARSQAGAATQQQRGSGSSARRQLTRVAVGRMQHARLAVAA